MNNTLVRPLATFSRTDVFFHVKISSSPLPPSTLAAVKAFAPAATNLYTGEEPAGPAGWNGWAHDAWRQRQQWQGCWDLVNRAEVESGELYHFVVRTRPDLLYDGARFKPAEWALWREHDGKRGYALCKCHHDYLDNADSYGHTPIIDAFFAAPRSLAAIFMTTWSRRAALTDARDDFYRWATRANCARRVDLDLHECLSLWDLNEHGFDLVVPPEMHVIEAYGRKEYTNVEFGSCRADAPGDVNGWIIYHHIAECFRRSGGCA